MIDDDLFSVNNIPFILDKQIVLLFKTITVLEGVCKTLDPSFAYTNILNHIAIEYFDVDFLFSKMKIDFQELLSEKKMVQQIDSERIYGMRIHTMTKTINDNNKMITAMFITILLQILI